MGVDKQEGLRKGAGPLPTRFARGYRMYIVIGSWHRRRVHGDTLQFIAAVAAGLWTIGMATLNVVPLPSSVRTSMLPLCF